MTEPTPGIAASTLPPETHAALRADGVAAVQERPDASRQAVLRRVHDVVNLSVALAQPKSEGLRRPQAMHSPAERPMGWVEWAQIWSQASAPGADAVLGEGRLFLARAPADGIGTVAATAALGQSLEPLLPYREDRARQWWLRGITTSSGAATPRWPVGSTICCVPWICGPWSGKRWSGPPAAPHRRSRKSWPGRRTRAGHARPAQPDDIVELHSDLVLDSDIPQDQGRAGQARPNVLFELGLALMAYPDNTVIVEVGRMRPLSDLASLNVIRFDGSAEAVKKVLHRLEVAGCTVDDSGVDWLDPGRFAGLRAYQRGPDDHEGPVPV